MKYRREIDGLRALAVVPVILFHAGFKSFSGGFVGVDVFFVISGYLITSLILDDLKSGTFSLARFYERRARRILPALFLVIFACLPAAWFWLLPQDMKAFAQSLIAVAFFVSNIFFWHTAGYFDSATELKPLIHTWSLSVEEQYYVLFPLLLLCVWRLGKRWLAPTMAGLAILSFGLAQWTTSREPTFAFYMLPTRAWELLLGALIALYFSNHSRALNIRAAQLGSLTGFALILYAVFAYSPQTPFPGVYALAPTLGAALIIVFANQQTLVGKLLSTKAFLGIGLISYSAYLWHQPLFAFARQRSIDEPSTFLMASLALLAFPIAFLSWKFIELPVRNNQVVSTRNVFVVLSVCTTLFVLVGISGITTSGFKNRPMAKAFEALEYNSDDLGYLDCKTAFAEQYGVEINYCHQTAKGPVNAILIGDSHADDKFYGLEKNDLSHNWGFMGNTSCPPVLGIQVEADQKDCQQKMSRIFDHVIHDPSIKVVALSFYGNYFLTTDYAADHIKKNVGPSTVKISSIQTQEQSRTAIFEYGLNRAINELVRAGKEVYLFVDVPELPFFPQECIKGKPNCTVSRDDVLARQQQHRLMMRSLAETYPQIHLIDPIGLFCDVSECHFKYSNIILYRDSHHLTFQGSEAFEKHLFPRGI